MPPVDYALGHAPQHQYPPTSHIPSMAPHAPCIEPYIPQIYPEPLTRINRHMVFDRVFLLLRDNLSEWWHQNPAALFHVTERIIDSIIRRGQAGAFGPTGLSSLTQIFLCIGHEGIYHYMCLAAHSGFHSIHVLLKGDLCAMEHRDPIFSPDLMSLCKLGFNQAAARLYADIYATRKHRK
ncbi:uncharacterized protein SETTUDRAFT_87470 [Exserohilum turcica Et28A]|uniref:Uncharacterized protein n=1 Tax=Exserohilum turcicum (strain 28A) TaxID=671987 RepID=R0KDG0_EXST2|nr:uncharacterized protein SETTUDRAFT_87470 [Exserohilum turcica Et28A]EOA87409.1 hypothetical protein SETTUDRAFT_87470 [Exserohilum turcica Et28A]